MVKIKIAMIGSGYVGLVSGACFAELGHSIICVDTNEEKISKLKNFEIPFYEPGLKELVEKNINNGRLGFTTSIKEAVGNSDIIFIAVGTPQNGDGSTNLEYLHKAVKDIASSVNGEKFIVTKSTVPVGTTNSLKEFFRDCKHEVHFISNPEFLREGSAIEEFMKPDRIIIGVNDTESERMMRNLYCHFSDEKVPILITDPQSSEMIKYVSNAMLATRISFINEIANFCEKVSANIDDVVKGVGLDNRIGPKFLRPGVGYGGSCFPKDVASLISQSNKINSRLKVLSEVNNVNAAQKEIIVHKIKKHFGNLQGKTFAMWGLSFKPDTDDMREASSIVIINKLLEHGAKIKAHDPVAMENAKKIFNDRIAYCKTKEDALKDADALILVTEWDEYKKADINKLKPLKSRVVFDGRNVLDKEKIIENGLEYYGIGR